MENRIPIDELFHDKLYQGKEQVNLGAWANMERMLDGKNPYAQEEEKKKRRIFPFWLMALLTTSLVGAGYFMTNSNHSATANNYPDTKVVEHIQPASRPSEKQIASASTSKSINKSDLVSSISSDIQTAPSTESNTSKALLHKSITKNTGHHIAIHSTERYLHTSSDNQVSPITQSSSEPLQKNNTNNQPHSDINKASVLNKVPTSNNYYAVKSKTESTSSAEEKNRLANATSLESVPTEKIEKIPTVTINQKTLSKRDGSIQKVIGDTVSKSVIEKVTQLTSENDAKTTASLDPVISNPRFKKLSNEDELNANKHRDEEPKVKPENEIVLASAASSKNSSEITIAANQKAKTTKHTGYFEDLRKFGVDTYRKISNFFMFSPKPDTYTGIAMGVNASLSNSKHNFGGFQGGVTSLTPINDYVSFLAEFRFFYRNNGGYTANDISYKILDPTQDTATLAHVQSTIYSYQKDSTVKTYNFKNFYSLELPLMLQLNYRSFALYGGMNLAYNFKLKTTDKSRNYVMSYRDTMAASATYSFPIDKASQYLKSDFSSRFGVGYTIGASYSFSPNLHIDLRISQNVLDNMKTLAAREISNGFFKVPSFQFSLGYRFRKFTPDN